MAETPPGSDQPIPTGTQARAEKQDRPVSPYETVADSYDSAATEELETLPSYSRGPSRWRGLLVILLAAGILGWLTTRGQNGADDKIGKLGRIEVSARLIERPDQFPNLGAYRYTYVLKYEVVAIHRPDPEGHYPMQLGDPIFVGHYKPWLPRSQIADSDWGDSPLGGKLDQFVTGEIHRMALDYELADLAPSGALDYCFPPGTNRFFALWTNPTSR